MFGKLKQAFSKFSRKVSEEENAKPTEKVVKKGIFEKFSEKRREYFLERLEEDLLQNNVAYDVVEKLKVDLINSKSKKVDVELKKIITNLLESAKPIDIIKLAKEKKKSGKPFTILFVGINGAGKTTTIAKIANIFKKNKFSCILAAGDTWRAAAIEQLGNHADKLKLRMVKHKYGADPAAVAFDAVRVKDAKVVLIDSAGRQQANADLMDELAKVKRVAKPDFTIFVGESITGNDCVSQVKIFNNKIGIDGVILTKADVDEKGGTLLSVVYTARKPVLFIGTGQRYQDIEQFNPKDFIKKII